MLCKILRDFNYSEDGHTTFPARVGAVQDIPSEMAIGLEAEGYLVRVREAKDAGPSPENKMVKEPAPENKVQSNRKGYRR